MVEIDPQIVDALRQISDEWRLVGLGRGWCEVHYGDWWAKISSPVASQYIEIGHTFDPVMNATLIAPIVAPRSVLAAREAVATYRRVLDRGEG
mgnify:CR=1 FL=1